MIHINEVILQLKQGKRGSLDYVRSTGSNKGSIKKFKSITYGMKFSKARTASNNRSRNKDMVVTGKLPIIDLQENRPMKLFISHMIAFNNETIIH